jgi:acetyl esterase/lipase
LTNLRMEADPNKPSRSAFKVQPLKTTYLAYQALSTLLFRLPYWLVRAIVPSLRPRRSWSIRRTVGINLLRLSFTILHKVGPLAKSPDHKELDAKKGILGVWVEPISSSYVIGEVERWAAQAGVQPIKLPGYWIHEKGSSIEMGAPPAPGEKVVYALHGGGYISLSAHPKDPTAVIAKKLIKHIDSVHRAFSIEYRLASTAPNPVANPFPTALIDALAGYNYLINTVGFAPDDIIIEGDSAGGNLALALVRYLIEHKEALPQQMNKSSLAPPGHIILSSPWCDIGSSHDTPGSSTVTLTDVDYIAPAGGVYPKLAFSGPHGIDSLNTNVYMSPASVHPAMERKGRFKGFPKTFIVCGGAECLRDSIRTLGELMKEDCGDKVMYYEAPDGVHDYIIFASGEPERTETFKEIARWVKEG